MVEPRLVTLVRRSSGDSGDVQLRALVSRRVPVDDAAPSKADVPPQWALEDVTIEGLPPSLAREAAPVFGAWDSLAQLESVGPEALAAFVVVLLETVPDLRSRASRGLVTAPKELPRTKPTAAHPRAFRGTKHKPPKPPKPPPLDLRGDLLDRAAVAHRLSENRSLLAAAFDLLVARGYERSRLERIVDGGEPYLAYHHGAKTAATFSGLGADFVLTLFPALRGAALTMSEVAEWQAYGSAAGLDGALRAGLVRLALLAPRHALRLGPVWMGAPIEQRALVVRALIHFDAAVAADAATASQWRLHAENFHRLLAGARDDVCMDRLAYLLRTAVAGGSIDYALDSISLFTPWHRHVAAEDIGRDPAARWTDVEPLVSYADKEPWFASWLFSKCGRLSGFAHWIRETDWTRFDPQSAARIVERIAALGWEDLSERDILSKWSLVRSELPKLLAWAHAEVPATHRASAIVLLLDYLHHSGRDVVHITARLPAAYAIVRRLALPPVRPDAPSDWLVGPVVRGLHEHPAALRRFLDAPERCFRALDRALRRENDALLIGRGLGVLLRHLPDFVIEAFVAYPRRLLVASKVFGVIDYDEAHARARPFPQHPIMDLRARLDRVLLGSTVLPEQARSLVHSVLPFIGPHTPNPVPKRLRDFAVAGVMLREGQLVRHLRRLRSALAPLILTELEEVVLRHARASIDLDTSSEAARHALLLERRTEENRRPLRRLLKAVACGHRDYLEQHPATLAFRKSHAAIGDAAWSLWIDGLAWEASHEGKRIRLGLERDTLEVLRMGTYAGSCLGLGGGLVYSAAAVALDLNKGVVYARDDAGVVVGRQLLALSEDDRLVCFYVYPLGADVELQKVFASYDRAFARALGLPIHEVAPEDTSEAVIASILSRGFWNDPAWDLEAT